MALQKRLKEILTTHPLLQEFLDILVHEPSILIEQFWDGPSKAIIIWLSQMTNKHVLIISSDLKIAYSKICSYFLCLIFANCLKTLPGEEIAPSSDLMGKRFEVLNFLENDSPHVVFAPLQAVFTKIALQRNHACAFSKIPDQSISDFSYLLSI